MHKRWFHILTITLVVIAQIITLFPVAYAAPPAARPAAINAGTVTNCSDDTDFSAKLVGGGTINFECGEATITVATTKTISTDTVIDGGGQITLSGGDLLRIFLVDANATLTLQNIVLADASHTGDGGAIGAAIGSTLIVDNTTFRDNQAVASGGAIVTYGTATIRNSRFENNSAANAGAIYVRWANGNVTIENSVFIENLAVHDTDGWGGAILIWDGAQATVRDSQFEGNTAQEGGAIYNTFGAVGSNLILERTRFFNNEAETSGGAIYNEAALQMTEVSIEANKAGVFGAGIYNTGGNVQGGSIRVIGNEIIDLEDDAYGGGIFNNTLFSGETPTAIGVVNLTHSTLSGNVAGRGGGIYSDTGTQVSLSSSSVISHSAANGGGLYTRGSIAISSTTFSGNSSSAAGGAIFKDDGTLNISFTTFAANGSGSNSSIYIEVGAETDNTLVGNIVQGRCAGQPLGSAGFNLESDNTCGFILGSDKQNVDPLLGPLGDNGGTTLTHLPAVGSPAINVAGESCSALDQRGFARPAEGICDMGAVESAAPPLTVTPFPTPPDRLPPRVTPEPVITPEPPTPPPPIVHATVPNGIAPTINVAPQSGRAGDSITVSGKSPTGAGQVRVVSMLDGQTKGTVMVDAAANGDYTLQFTVPPDTRAGPIELCATLPAEANAQFACKPFQINAPPPASVTASLPTGITGSTARLLLLNGAGNTVYSGALQSNGIFNISNVAAGIYKYNVVGQLSKPVSGGVLSVGSGKKLSASLISTNPCLFVSALNSTGAVSATPSRSSMVAKQSAFGNISGSAVKTILGGSGAPVFTGDSRPIGLYVAGVTNIVTFEASPQTTGALQGVIFEFINRDSKRVGDAIRVNAAPWRTTFDVGRLAASSGTSHPRLKVTPIVGGKEECPYYIDIEVIRNPFQVTGVQPNSIVWDTAKGNYRIQGIVPHIPGVLPSSFQFPPPPVPALPYLGRYNNRLNAGIQVVGTLNLDGMAHIQAIRTVTDLYLFNNQIAPPDWQITLLKPNIKLPIQDIRETSLPFGPYPLFPDVYLPTPFLEVPVISFFGLIDVTVNASAGIGAGVQISGYVKPFKPAVGATMTATGKAHAELGVGIRLLAGLARAGATARLDAELGVPLTIFLDTHVGAELDACLTFRFSVRAYASALWGFVSHDSTKEIAKWSGCVSEVAAASLGESFQTDPSLPDVLAAPVVAIGSNGAQVTAYVENTAAAGATPQVQILARLRAGDNEAWSEPVALSNVAYSADAPVVALVGPDQWPMVAWAEKKLTFEEANALNGDMNAVLQRQEIVYRLYRDGQWEPAVYLTADLLGDGLPALAGSTGSALLAWTRDLDGDWLTRADQRIAVTTFDVATRTFAPFALLDGGGPGLNGDVRVAIDASSNRPYVVWVHDTDADLNSAEDRRLALAFYENLEWVMLNPQPLPPRVDSPTITIGPEGVLLAFLVREPDENNAVGLLGTNGVLWTARVQNGLWSAAPVLDANNQPTFAEEPVLANNGTESLLLFRRFGQEDDNSQYGQVALSRIIGMGLPTTPLYITDEPRQNWQAHIAINPVNGQANIMRVGRTAIFDVSIADLSQETSIASTSAIAAVQSITLNNAEDPVEMSSYTATADPALDPLDASTRHPAAGSSFIISATVRNVGRENANGVVVRLYAGIPGNGTLLQSSDPLPTLSFNAIHTVGFAPTSNGGVQSFYVEVVASGPEGSTGNNVATLEVGKLSAPVMVDVYESLGWVDGLDVSWIAPQDEIIQGYRILRGNAADGEFTLMGESSVPGFTDVPLPRETTFCYAVESYNANTISPRSQALCAELAAVPDPDPDPDQETDTLFLPTLKRVE